MIRCRIESVACAMATERKLPYGWSIFDGAWYVGTSEQLTAIGVLDPTQPVSCDTSANEDASLST